MSLLPDENLSPRLVARLLSLFPELTNPLLSSLCLKGNVNSGHRQEEPVGVIQERYEFVMDIESTRSVIQGIDDDAG